MKTIYKLTSDEQRYVQGFYTQYLNALQTIAAIHDIKGQLQVTPDQAEFIISPEPETKQS
jgi:hypothetical protein